MLGAVEDKPADQAEGLVSGTRRKISGGDRGAVGCEVIPLLVLLVILLAGLLPVPEVMEAVTDTTGAWDEEEDAAVVLLVVLDDEPEIDDDVVDVVAVVWAAD